MAGRTIDSPGIEILRYDSSELATTTNKKDNSLPGAPISFCCGFSSKGEDYIPRWINSYQTLDELLGTPMNEAERYLYNTVNEILSRGGIAICSKLPYYNASKDKYTFVEYKLSEDIVNLNTPLDYDVFCKPIKNKNYIDHAILSSINEEDSTVTSMLTIFTDPDTNSGRLSIEEIDELKTNPSSIPKNTFKIIDISRTNYNKVNFNCVKSNINISNNKKLDKYIQTNEILGVIPVVVSPANALYFQKLINSELLNQETEEGTVGTELNPMKGFKPINIKYYSEENKNELGDNVYKLEGEEFGFTVDKFYNTNAISVDMSKLNDNTSISYISETQDEESISKIVTDLFPEIDFKDYEEFNKKYFKCIGVVVLKPYIESLDNNKISFKIVESFVGSLDKTAKNENNGSFFIGNIINNNSKYINFYSNIDKLLLESVDICKMDQQIATSLGFYNLDTIKNIDFDISIQKPINIILEYIKNPKTINIDLIVDAGLTNIAQYAYTYNLNKGVSNYISEMDLSTISWELNNSEDRIKWLQIANKIDNFVKNTRKDCIFLLDAPRGFCLEGNEKIVRKTKPSNTVSNVIIPKLKFISGLNSSYTAGYCNWFKVIDKYSGDFFWCPPSSKVCGIIIDNDVYAYRWTAPAGMTHGVLNSDVIDIAFTPSTIESGKIYKQNWNYAMNYPLQGIVIEGQKTFQMNSSALNRINVRRLMLYIEKYVTNIAKYFVYEQNTPQLRTRFIDATKPIFENAVNGNGISEYLIKCDDELNDEKAIENQEFYAKMAVRPIKAIEYIILSFSVANQTVSLSETITK